MVEHIAIACRLYIAGVCTVVDQLIIRVCMNFLGLKVIIGNKEKQVSAGPVAQVTGFSLAAGVTYGIGVLARNSIGQSKTFVGTFSVPGESSHLVHGLLMCVRDGPH